MRRKSLPIRGYLPGKNRGLSPFADLILPGLTPGSQFILTSPARPRWRHRDLGPLTAMHTYDGVEYDPLRDNLIVVASPGHNPVAKQIQGAKSDAIWLYDLTKKMWSAFDNSGENSPSKYFGAATAYEEAHDRLFICKAGIWSLDLQNSHLKKN